MHVLLNSDPTSTNTFHKRIRKYTRLLPEVRTLKHLRSILGKMASLSEPAGLAEFQAMPAREDLRDCRAVNDTSPLTVISSNLCHDWPLHRQQLERVEEFSRLVEAENADLLLLQEVSRRPELKINEWLSQRLGMAYVYTRANGHQNIGFEEGLAIFSRFPMNSLLFKQLDNQRNPFVRRLALGARIDTPCGAFIAVSTHLSLFKVQNKSQVRDLQEWIDGLRLNLPVVIGGDFNAHENTRHMRQVGVKWMDTFRHHSPSGDGTTHVLRGPAGIQLRRRRLDYIFFHPGNTSWKILDSRHLQTPGRPHSDHYLVLSRIYPTLIPDIQA